MNLLPALSQLFLSRLRWLFATGDRVMNATPRSSRYATRSLFCNARSHTPQFTKTDRTILAVLSTMFIRKRMNQVFLIVQPATVIGRHCRLVARHWTQPNTSSTGRTAVISEIRSLAVRRDRAGPNDPTTPHLDGLINEYRHAA